MSKLSRLLATGVAGAMLGMVLAVAAPPAPTAANASASLADCVCYDGWSGNYQCAEGQDECEAGSQHCLLSCN